MIHARFPLPGFEHRDMQLRSRTLDCPVTLELRADAEDGTVEGYGSVFGVKDAHWDVVQPGAFAKSLQAHAAAGTLPVMLWQHRSDEPCGVWTEMREDARGLYCKGQLILETARGREAHALLKAKAIRGLSIGFQTKEAQEDRASGVRNVTEAELWEVSLVTFPSNGAAQITGVKAAVDQWERPADAERALREAGFSRSDATAAVSRLLRFGEERREAADALAQASAAAARLLANLTS